MPMTDARAGLAMRPPASPWIVGLTGGVGSGKSTVAEHFERLGVGVVDTDRIAHELTGVGGEALAEIRAEFGDPMIDAGGALDRQAMRSLVFADPQARARLEAILHPRIRALALQECLSLANRCPYVMLVVPLLIESPALRALCQRILVVDLAEQEQEHRVMRRSGLSREAVRAIIAAQIPRAERLAAADDCIDNQGGVEQLAPQVAKLHRAYLAQAASAISV